MRSKMAIAEEKSTSTSHVQRLHWSHLHLNVQIQTPACVYVCSDAPRTTAQYYIKNMFAAILKEN